MVHERNFNKYFRYNLIIRGGEKKEEGQYQFALRGGMKIEADLNENREQNNSVVFFTLFLCRQNGKITIKSDRRSDNGLGGQAIYTLNNDTRWLFFKFQHVTKDWRNWYWWYWSRTWTKSKTKTNFAISVQTIPIQ